MASVSDYVQLMKLRIDSLLLLVAAPGYIATRRVRRCGEFDQPAGGPHGHPSLPVDARTLLGPRVPKPRGLSTGAAPDATGRVGRAHIRVGDCRLYGDRRRGEYRLLLHGGVRCHLPRRRHRLRRRAPRPHREVHCPSEPGDRLGRLQVLWDLPRPRPLWNDGRCPPPDSPLTFACRDTTFSFNIAPTLASPILAGSRS